MPTKDILSQFKFFSDAAPEARNAIASICEILDFKQNDTVFRYEDPSEHFYGLMDGEVELSIVFTDRVLKTEIEYEEAVHARMVDEQKQIVLDTVRPGQVFGWSSIVGPGRRTVTARCKKPSRVLALPAADLKNMFNADHSLGYFLMKGISDIISKRLKTRTDKLIETWVEAFDVGEIK